MSKVAYIKCQRFSSKYGESNNSFGQPLGVKTIVLITVLSSSGDSRSHELYAGIYCPDILPTLVNDVSKIFIGNDISLSNAFSANKLPFIGNSGIIKAIIGAIDSCIIQLYFASEGINLVDGLRSLLNNNIKRLDNKDIKYYGSGGSVSYSPDECLEDAKQIVKKDFDGFKMRCGLQGFENDLKRVSLVQEYLSNINLSSKKEINLMIDFIQGTLRPKLSVEGLLKYIRDFENFKVLWFEEPLDPDDISLYTDFLPQVGDNYNLCLGESFTCLNEFVAYKNLINFFQLDVTHLGGFPETIKVLNYMSRYHPMTMFSSHLWGSGLSGLLNLALCRASNTIIWFEVPLLSFEINKHMFGEFDIDYPNITNNEIDKLLANINLEVDDRYKFIENSGYKI
ncbi:hypothetical protein OA981_02655 [Prochlorococcus sp. AH-716-A09]|nr:hypothetical protein [Prochlorococcus sp. AH-716-A09]